MSTRPQITATTTMGEILAAYPAAKVGLFQRYHIGGCQACGYRPEDTVEDVCREHEIDDAIESIIECIETSAAIEAKLHVDAAAVKAALERGEPLRLLDTRLPSEFETAHLPGAALLTTELTFEALDSWPPDAPVITYSNHGRRSLDKASYLTAYGLSAVRSLDGGLEAWRAIGGQVVTGAEIEPLPLTAERESFTGEMRCRDTKRP